MRIFIVVLLGLALLACRKKDNTLGKELLNSNQYLDGITTDTFYLVTSSILEDSMVTDNVSNVVLGQYIDPMFGDFNASFYTQIRIAATNPDFGNINEIIVDSMVLGLKYVGYYGDFTPQTFEVFELTDPMYNDSTYYSFDHINHAATNLMDPSKSTITPDPVNFTVIGGDSVQAQLRLYLDTTLAKQFITEATSGNGSFASIEAFQNYFKGFYVRANNAGLSAGQGGVFYFNLNDPATKLTIYYRQSGTAKTYDFLMNSICADFSHVDVNRNGSPVNNAINNSSQGMQEFYAQAFGVRAKVIIPGLNQFTKNQLIHRAEIHLPVQYSSGNKFKPGASVTFATKKSINALTYLNTGVLGAYSETNKEFSADVKQYAQAVINQDIENTGLYVSPLFFINSAERIIFNGQNTLNKKRPKIIITYTHF
jgi:hypothetical protein